MSRSAVSALIRNRYRTQFAEPNSIPTQYDNMPFAQPNDSAWATAEVRYETPAAGAMPIRYGSYVEGVFVVTLFAPMVTGQQLLMTLAESFADVFSRVSLGEGLHMRSPVVMNQGHDGASWKLKIETPFYAETIIP